RSRQAVGPRVQPEVPAPHDNDDAGEGSRRISEAAGVRARRRRPHLSVRRSLAAHSGVPVNHEVKISANTRSGFFEPQRSQSSQRVERQSSQRKRYVLFFVLFVVLVVRFAPRPVFAQAAADPQYAEAKRLFEALDYESAIRALDLAVAGLEVRPAQDPVRRELLPNAYEMRARSKFGLGDQNGAK